MVAKRIIFEGRVQGVGFRYSTKELALGFEVQGTVENLEDGTVRLILLGELEEVEEYIHELTVESAVATHIKKVHVEEIEVPTVVVGFRIVG